MMEPQPDPFLLVGTTLAGKYAVESVVAETALSVVYRATHRVWQRPVAIKAFKASGLGESARKQLLESFVREGALLMDLSERCSAICQARDVGSTITGNDDWVPYMVLEWLEGEPLDLVLRHERAFGGPPRSVEQAIRLLDPIARALSLAHERHVVHGDIKPANVFVLAESALDGSRCKLLDFGVAKVLGQGGTGAAGGTEPHTGADPDERFVAKSFTPAYGAPEQFDSQYGPVGPWTDVFALALVFVEILSGKEPLQGNTLEELAVEVCNPASRPTPGRLGAAVPDPIERVLTRALAVPPEERYANARDFWIALTCARQQHESTAKRRKSNGRGPRSLRDVAPDATATIPLGLTRRRSFAGRRRVGRFGWTARAAAFVGAAVAVLGVMSHYYAPAPTRATEAWSRLQAASATMMSRFESSQGEPSRRGVWRAAR